MEKILNNLSEILIEKELLNKIINVWLFHDNVINKFPNLNDRGKNNLILKK